MRAARLAEASAPLRCKDESPGSISRC